MTSENPFLYDCIQQYERVKQLAERAMQQVDDDHFFRDLGDDSNSIAIIVKHMAGNMRSRWTDFLTADGEKPDRNRDSEFTLDDAETRPQLMAAWDTAWALVLDTIGELSDTHLDATVLIRGEAHTVREAVLRQLNHYAYHAGQIVLIAKIGAGASWKSLSVPRGKSEEFNRAIRRGSERHV